MGLETATYIGDLNEAYPTSGDPRKQGDDHIRLIKAVLKASFPGMSWPYTVPPPFPTGTRLAFAQGSAPTGWTQDTSDAANNRMLRVVASPGGGTGGSHSPVLNNVVPGHTHTASASGQTANHAHNYSSSAAGGGAFPTILGDSTFDPIGAFSRGGLLDDNAGAATNPPWRSQYINVADHVHYGTTDPATGDHAHVITVNANSGTDWMPRYIDLILCTKN